MINSPKGVYEAFETLNKCPYCLNNDHTPDRQNDCRLTGLELRRESIEADVEGEDFN